MRTRLIVAAAAFVATAALFRGSSVVQTAPKAPASVEEPSSSRREASEVSTVSPDLQAVRASYARHAQPIVGTAGGKQILRDGAVNARFSPEGLSICVLDRGAKSGWRLDWSLEGSRPVTPLPEGELAVKINSMIGEQSQWSVSQSAYSRTRYPEVQPGVDLVYESRPHGLEYSFEIAPGSVPGDLRMRVGGASAVRVNDRGDAVEIQTGLGTVRESGLIAYQEANGARVPVAARYRSTGPDSYAIELGAYDTSRALVVDPTISWSAYVGGAYASDSWYASDDGRAVAVDSFGDLYIAGSTNSMDIATSGAFQVKASDVNLNAYIAKLHGDGSGIVWATYLGSPYPTGLALDAARNVYMTGWGPLANFPIVGGFQSKAPGTDDSVVAKLSADGATLIWSSYLGGSNVDMANAIAVDASGNVYVAGETTSGDFPVLNGIDTGFDFNGSSFVTKIAASGAAILWSSRIGGVGYDSAQAIALDASDNIYVAGRTQSASFPVTTGTIGQTLKGNNDGFVYKLRAAGNVLAWATYLGGTTDDYAQAIAVDSGNNVYVGGFTDSADFPVKAGFQMTLQGSFNGFVTKLNSSATRITWSTYLGGSNTDVLSGLALDSSNNVVVVGSTNSLNFPVLNAFRSQNFSSTGGFVTKIKAAGNALAWSSYTGGFGTDPANVVAVDAGGNVTVLGQTNSTSTIATTNGFDQTLGGAQDAFVLKVTSAGALSWASYYGGRYVNGESSVAAMAIDAAANVYVTGKTDSVDFPATVGAFQVTKNPGTPHPTTNDAFVTKISKTGALVWSTYLGGSGDDQGYAIAVDGSQNVYVTGLTQSTDFPVTAGSYRTTGDGNDIFVSKLNPTGSALVWSTYLGGVTGVDTPYAIALDASNNVVVAGQAGSADFPMVGGGFDTTLSGSSDAFIAKLGSGGKALLWSTFLGGAGAEAATALKLDSGGNVYVGGWTSSLNFPTTGGFQTSYGGGNQDAFVAKLTSTGKRLTWGSFLGGSGDESVAGLAVNAGGDVYVAGMTSSTNFPVTALAFQGAYGGGSSDGFLTRVKAAGSALVWSSYLGGSGADSIGAIVLDSAGNPLVTGTTSSTNFPLVNAFRTTLGGFSDAFVTKVPLSGGAPTWSSLLGGNDEDDGLAIGIDAQGHVYVAGMTRSSDLGTAGTFDSTHVGDFDGFVTRIDQ